jgi:hypothetical protein
MLASTRAKPPSYYDLQKVNVVGPIFDPADEDISSPVLLLA